MPLYDVKCLECGWEFEEFAKIADRNEIKCEKCGKKTKILPSPPKKDWFKPHWNEHISEDGPIFIKSRSHLKEECRKHGCYAKIFGRGDNITEI